MKTNTKKILKSAAILYGVLLGVILVSVLAWFVLDKSARKGGKDDMTITASGNLEISLDGDSWNKKLIPQNSYNCPIITSDGVNFYYSDTLNTDDDPLLDEAEGFFDINSSEDKSDFYVDVVVHFRDNGNSSVYLQNSSFIKGVDMGIDSATGKNVPKGAIAGALRVAFYEIPADKVGDSAYQPTADDLKCIWIPNDKNEISTDADGNIKFNSNGKREDTYGYLSSAAELNTWAAEDYAGGKIAVGNTDLATSSATANAVYYTINSATPLLDFDGSEGAEKTLLIRIWVEGTDREAQSRLSSDMVRYKFDFVAIEKQNPSDADVAALKSIAYDGSNGLTYTAQGYDFLTHPILYSYDGITWAPYEKTNHPGISNGLYTKPNGDKVLFVKLNETADTKPSECHEVLVIPASTN